MRGRSYTTFQTRDNDEPEAWFVCPHCGNKGIRFPTRPEVWREYQAAGIIDFRQNVVEVQHIHCLSERDVFLPISVYLPACVLSGTLAQAGALPWLIFQGVLVGGAIGVLMFAVRYRRGVAEPQEATEPESEAEASRIPDTTEVVERTPIRQSLFMFSRDAVKYPSGDIVPDYHLWAVAQAWVRGISFSRQMYAGDDKVTTRPAFEALRDAFIRAGIAYNDGQDTILHARARHVLRQWATLNRPPFVVNSPRVGTVR